MTTLANPRNVLAAKRRLDAINLRIAGATYEAIGYQLGISRQAAHKAVLKELRTLTVSYGENADQLREIMVARLERAVRAVYQGVIQGNLGSVDRLVRLIERESKLLGLDRPTEVEQTGEVTVRVVRDPDWEGT